MESVSDHLLDALDDLETDELKRFKWRLKNRKGFSRADLEKADAPDTVDLMMKCFVPEEAVKITVGILRKMNQNHLAEQLEKKHKQAQAEGSIEGPDPAGASSEPTKGTDPKTRNDFLQYSHQLALDLNTVNKHLRLFERNRVITDTNTPQSYPDHPDRFDYYLQVLCRESVSDRRCYWEVERRGEHGVSISVSYKSISRKGEGYECGFGYNDQSWSLDCSSSSYSFRHDNTETNLPVEPISSREEVNGYYYRVGVYVNHRAGTLSFYSVSGDSMIPIHTVQTTFTQPLYPGFGVLSYGSSMKLC
ncbi:tripartite motif-containing protein 16-like isoform X1 [Megalobrama amblycephala]|uniref:tripartite motif-containing protein 16-like isoform X1 n=1 Tax=Megalobrama amblycephala TaxID=75352 RepID=UPI0020147381|nr:tripartite motif-containing protein 16-like isoform X1 [Megalobrama amblycephala]